MVCLFKGKKRKFTGITPHFRIEFNPETELLPTMPMTTYTKTCIRPWCNRDIFETWNLFQFRNEFLQLYNQGRSSYEALKAQTYLIYDMSAVSVTFWANKGFIKLMMTGCFDFIVIFIYLEEVNKRKMHFFAL